jgi:hypothetical protein
MDEMTKGTVIRVLGEVLERQVFMFADAADRDFLAGAEGPFLTVSMGFRGEAEGEVVLALSDTLAMGIAANFLGLDASDPSIRSRSRDCCKELLNVVCGNLLTALCGEEPVFDLSIPRDEDVSADTVMAWSGNPGSMVFNVEDEPLLLSLRFAPVPDPNAAKTGRS